MEVQDAWLSCGLLRTMRTVEKEVSGPWRHDKWVLLIVSKHLLALRRVEDGIRTHTIGGCVLPLPGKHEPILDRTV